MPAYPPACVFIAKSHLPSAPSIDTQHDGTLAQWPSGSWFLRAGSGSIPLVPKNRVSIVKALSALY